MSIPVSLAADTQADPSALASSPQTLFEALSQQIPRMRSLALHQLPDLKCRWVYDFGAKAFVSTARQKAFKPLLLSQDPAMQTQFTTYSESYEYILRAENCLISCDSGRELTNQRLLELALQTHQQAILALQAAPAKKQKRKASVPALPAAKIESYQLIKALAKRPQLSSHKLKDRLTGRLYLLKCLNEQSLADYPELCKLLAGSPRIDEFSHFEADTKLAGRALVRPFIEGVTLRELVQKVGQLSVAQAFFIAARVGELIQPLHTAGLAHGNLSPDNILVTREKQILVTDHFLDALHRPHFASSPDAPWLTALRPYLAPEYLSASTPATDVYTLGALTLFMLSGQSRFVAEASDPAGLATMAEALLKGRYSKGHTLVSRMVEAGPEQRPSDGATVSRLLHETEHSN